MSAFAPNRHYSHSAACKGVPVNINITTSILQHVVVNVYHSVPFRRTVLLSTPTESISRRAALHVIDLVQVKTGGAADVFLPCVKLKGSIGPAETANKKRGATDKKGEWAN